MDGQLKQIAISAGLGALLGWLSHALHLRARQVAVVDKVLKQPEGTAASAVNAAVEGEMGTGADGK